MLDWIVDCGYAPHLIVDASSDAVQVPRQFVKEGRIVLNISASATQSFQIGAAAVEFSARFSGVSHRIRVPVEHVLGIYARETGRAWCSRKSRAVMPACDECIRRRQRRSTRAASAGARPSEAPQPESRQVTTGPQRSAALNAWRIQLMAKPLASGFRSSTSKRSAHLARSGCVASRVPRRALDLALLAPVHTGRTASIIAPRPQAHFGNDHDAVAGLRHEVDLAGTQR